MKSFAVDPDDPRSQLERMLEGDWYIADDPDIQRQFRRALRETSRFNDVYAQDPDASQGILGGLLGGLGDGAHVRAPLRVDYGSRLFIGAGTFVNFGLVALDVVDIRIGERCQLGPNIQLLTPIHPLEREARARGWEAAEPITLEDDVWLGGGVIVCPGVTVGAGAVVGAGSVVTSDVPPGVLAVGSPARVVREL
jgi:maltose O-acetyltransferase